MRLVVPATSPAGELTDRELEHLYAYPDTATKWLAVNFVSSADGAVAIAGRSRGLSDGADRKILQLGSDLADVLLVGAGTAMDENFRGVHPGPETVELRRRHGLPDLVTTAVVTNGRSLPADAPVITEAPTPTIVITTSSTDATRRRAWADAGATVLVTGDELVDLPAAVEALTDRGLRRIDCEGGPVLFASLVAADLVDELRLTVSPMLVCGPAGRIARGHEIDPARLELNSAIAADSTLLLRYLVRR